MKCLRLKIKGRVQGVWFRESTKQKADEFEICGWVQNSKDGSVIAEAEGEEEKLQNLIKWCHQGPEMARVEKVEVEEMSELRNYSNFEVRW
jgi:acylphosphatase